MKVTTPSGAADLAARLRNACTSVRSKSYPLADLIPLMQQAADALASAPAQPVAEASRFGSPELQAMIIARCVEKDQADSVQEDAARYRWLREGNDAKHGAAWHVAVNLYGCEWDAAIDAAMNKGATP